MAKRRNQTAEEIADLADRFRESWNEGRVLRSWLKAHADEILELAKNHWSWENLGKALTSAGITYQTGTPWTGENLRRNLKRTLIPGKRELKLLRMGPGPDGGDRCVYQGARSYPARECHQRLGRQGCRRYA